MNPESQHTVGAHVMTTLSNSIRVFFFFCCRNKKCFVRSAALNNSGSAPDILDQATGIPWSH